MPRTSLLLLLQVLRNTPISGRLAAVRTVVPPRPAAVSPGPRELRKFRPEFSRHSLWAVTDGAKSGSRPSGPAAAVPQAVLEVSAQGRVASPGVGAEFLLDSSAKYAGGRSAKSLQLPDRLVFTFLVMTRVSARVVRLSVPSLRFDSLGPAFSS